MAKNTSPPEISQSSLIALDSFMQNKNLAEKQIAKLQTRIRKQLSKGLTVESGEWGAILVDGEVVVIPPEPAFA